jgi:hypothetical protein
MDQPLERDTVPPMSVTTTALSASACRPQRPRHHQRAAHDRGRVQRGDRPLGCLTITDKTRKHTLALELARLDELQEVF